MSGTNTTSVIYGNLTFIAAMDNRSGIGKNGTLAWDIKEDMAHFRKVTQGGVVIMGSKTYNSISHKFRPLKGRDNIIITNNDLLTQNNTFKEGNTSLLYCNFEECTKLIKTYTNSGRNVFICGGGLIYNMFMKELGGDIDIDIDVYIDMTFIYKNYKCDTFYPSIDESFELIQYGDKIYDSKEKVFFRFLLYKRKTTFDENSMEKSYHQIINEIIEQHQERIDRTKVGTIGVFGKMMTFDVSKYIPILTTKRVPFKTCLHELLWFLRGSTNNKELTDVGVHIWDGNSTREYLNSIGLNHLKENDCGAIYGFQWRHFGAKYIDCHTDYTNKGVDQLEYVIKLLREDPFSRRIIINAWNPVDVIESNGCLPPCHMSIQFYVEEVDEPETGKLTRYLSGMMYQRSADWFLGVPFNILSYAILLHLIALKCGYKPKELKIITGDSHIYKNHINQIKEQCQREYLSKPKLWINPDIKDKDWKDMTVDDFDLIGYLPHPAIKGKMAV
jgi:dihydrofolate reductase/thymidylate synthase